MSLENTKINNVLQLRSIIGSGGFSVVYEAYHLELHRPVAVKILHNTTDNSLDRFVREARICAGKLVHDNIVRIYGLGKFKGQLYMVMELVTGTPLSDMIAEGPVDWKKTIDVSLQVLAGLAHAHKHGVVHRDLKPANILIDSTGKVKICDFGMAKLQDASRNLTGTGDICGTPLYISPEQIGGSPVDGRSDIYSLGCIMYEMITGAKPFITDNLIKIASMHLHTLPPMILQIPEGIDQAVRKAMAKRPADRYISAEQFISVLKDLQATPDSLPGYVRPPLDGTVGVGDRKWLRIGRIAASFSMLVAVLIMAGIMFYKLMISNSPFEEYQRRAEIGRNTTKLHEILESSKVSLTRQEEKQYSLILSKLLSLSMEHANCLKKHQRFGEAAEVCRALLSSKESRDGLDSRQLSELWWMLSQIHASQSRNVASKFQRIELLEQSLNDMREALYHLKSTRYMYNYCLLLVEAGHVAEAQKVLRRAAKEVESTDYLPVTSKLQGTVDSNSGAVKEFTLTLQEMTGRNDAAYSADDCLIICDMFLDLCTPPERVHSGTDKPVLESAHLWFSRACSRLSSVEKYSLSVRGRAELLARLDNKGATGTKTPHGSVLTDPGLMISETEGFGSLKENALSGGKPKVFYLSKNGDNSTGTDWAHAFKEMNQIRWNEVNSGDTIIIDGGPQGASMTYYTALTVGKDGCRVHDDRGWHDRFINITVTTQANAPHNWKLHAGKVIINGTSTGIDIGSHKYVSIIGRELDRASRRLGSPNTNTLINHCATGIEVGPDSSNIVLKNLEIANSSQCGLRFSGSGEYNHLIMHDNQQNALSEERETRGNHDPLDDTIHQRFVRCWFYNGGSGIWWKPGIRKTCAKYEIHNCVFGPTLTTGMYYDGQGDELDLRGNLMLNAVVSNFTLGPKARSSSIVMDHCTSFLTPLSILGHPHSCLSAVSPHCSLKVTNDIFWGGIVLVPADFVNRCSDGTVHFRTNGNTTFLSAGSKDSLLKEKARIANYTNDVSNQTLVNTDFSSTGGAGGICSVAKLIEPENR